MKKRMQPLILVLAFLLVVIPVQAQFVPSDCSTNQSDWNVSDAGADDVSINGTPITNGLDLNDAGWVNSFGGADTVEYETSVHSEVFGGFVIDVDNTQSGTTENTITDTDDWIWRIRLNTTNTTPPSIVSTDGAFNNQCKCGDAGEPNWQCFDSGFNDANASCLLNVWQNITYRKVNTTIEVYFEDKNGFNFTVDAGLDLGSHIFSNAGGRAAQWDGFVYSSNSSCTQAVVSDTPTITVHSPINEQFVADDIVNVTVSSDINVSRCDLFTNETGVFNSTSHILDQTGNTNFTLQHDPPVNITTDFIYFVDCNSTTGEHGNSSQITIHYDNQNPLTFYTIPNSQNTTGTFDFITLQIDVMNTNLQNVTWNITNSSGTEIYQNDTFGLVLGTSYTILDTIDLTQNTTGVYTIQVHACDINLCSDTFATFNLTILESGVIFVNYTIPTGTINATTIIIINSSNTTFINWFCINHTSNQTLLLISSSGNDGTQTLNATINQNCLSPRTILELTGNCTGTNSFCEFFEERILVTTQQTSTVLTSILIALLIIIPILVTAFFLTSIIRKKNKR